MGPAQACLLSWPRRGSLTFLPGLPASFGSVCELPQQQRLTVSDLGHKVGSCLYGWINSRLEESDASLPGARNGGASSGRCPGSCSLCISIREKVDVDTQPLSSVGFVVGDRSYINRLDQWAKLNSEELKGKRLVFALKHPLPKKNQSNSVHTGYVGLSLTQAQEKRPRTFRQCKASMKPGT